MKNIYFIGGTMGVGKTTVSNELLKRLPHCVFLDGDWCWMADPFQVTEETKTMVTDNICHLLNNFIKCSAYENVVFCWVMYQQSIIDELIERIDTRGCKVHKISLTASEAAIAKRLKADIDAGIRQQDIIERSIARIPLYEELDTIKIDVSDITPPEIADIIAGL